MLFATWLPPQWTFIRQSIMLLALWRRPAKLKHSSNVKIAGPFIMDERRLTGKKSLSNTSGKMVQCWQAASHDSCRRRERQSLVCATSVRNIASIRMTETPKFGLRTHTQTHTHCQRDSTHKHRFYNLRDESWLFYSWIVSRNIYRPT